MKRTILMMIFSQFFYSALLLAQSTATANQQGPTEQEVQELRNALRSQQQETQDLRQQLQQAVQALQAVEQKMQSQSQAAASGSTGPAREVQASLRAPASEAPADPPAQDQGKAKESVLSFRIGEADFTPGGFVDISNVYRSTDVGSGTPTSFFAIPFNNTTSGSLSEDRVSAQNSRLTLKVTDQLGKNNVTGYTEMDFNGNSATNVFVNTNPSTARLRLFWVDVKRGKWEFLAGQTWGWLTPNRFSLSPDPTDIFNTLNVDNNYQVGLTYTRAPEFRVAYHFNPHWAFGIGIEDPEQFAGQSGEVTFPTAFNTALTGELDSGALSSTPNKYPDVISKLTYDAEMAGKQFHAEAAGLVTTVQVATTPGRNGDSSTGGGIEYASSLELLRHLRLVTTAFYSDGGGRYIGGLGPDSVVKPDGGVSLVHSGSGTGGFEYQLSNNDTVAAYYGGAYYQRDFFADTTTGAKKGMLEGFGFPGSSNAADRALQEGTADWIHTFWRSPNYGALQLLTQYSYVTRSPWSVAANAPKNAHLGMAYVDVRYLIP